ncbi:STAS domain-containing protein [Marinobacter sp. X15-166B]|uniref:STAS domain-containing protein n=1 Tax=Marinobacter sp. X15-166B TaxID=1897620 RepID=UPI00085CB1B7|nr:STAS domain-containing protein [Marinobacter sp. X15-166B]OEY65194.1 hypothetical protein BG841_01085 [Marinobacter sp. X15-166B]
MSGIRVEGSRLTVTDNVTPEQVLPLRTRGEELVAQVPSPVVIDLAGVTEPHTVVLSLALCWMRAAQAQGKTVEFVGAGRSLQALAALGGVTDLLPGFAGGHEQG